MIGHYLVVVVLAVSGIFFSPSARSSTLAEIRRDLRTLDGVARRTDAAIANMVRAAALTLGENGHEDAAWQIETEYQDSFENFLEFMVSRNTKDLGDHAPLSEWLDEWYQRLEDLLGPEVMRLTHLDDIWVVNFAVPVVFDPRREKGIWDDPEPQEEYSEHFIPLAGVVAYWGAWISCTVATLSTGAVTYICAPIASGVEYIMVRYVAPPLSDRVYLRANEPRD